MIIGTCSLCGGPVESPDAWMGVMPAPATCKSCGAVKPQHGPVIEMQSSGDAPLKYTYSVAEGREKEVHHHYYQQLNYLRRHPLYGDMNPWVYANRPYWDL